MIEGSALRTATPSVWARAAWDKWRAQARGLDAVVQGAVALFALAFLGGTLGALLTPPALVLLCAVGGMRAWRLRTGAETGWWKVDSPRRAVGVTITATCLALILWLAVAPLLALLLTLAAVELVTRQPPDAPGVWWSRPNLTAALTKAKVLNGETGIGYRGKAQHGDYGTSIKVALPGVTYGQVHSRIEHIARELRVPVSRVDVHHDEDDAPNVITLTKFHEAPKNLPDLPLPDVCSVADGVTIGLDRKGRQVPLRLVGAHTAIVGTTGSGKTRVVRRILAQALLDPAASVYVLDGKDDAADLRPMQHLCERFVGLYAKDGLAQAEALLLEIEALSAERGAAGRDHPPVIVVIDEWARVRLKAERTDLALAKRLDNLLAELAATCRSRNISLVLMGQRGTAEFMPTDARANFAQRIVGRVAETADARYLLGRNPALLPARPGQWLVDTDEHGEQLVMAALFTDEAFHDAIRRAEALRVDVPRPRLVEPVPDDPFDSTVRLLLLDGPLTPTVLRERLPDELRQATEQACWNRLREVPGVERGWEGNRRVYRLDPSVDPSVTEGRPVGADVNPASTGPVHAQSAPVRLVPSEVSA